MTDKPDDTTTCSLMELNGPIIDHKISKLIAESIAAEHEDAEKSGVLGFMARSLVQASMPHKNIKEVYFKRTNGNYSLVMSAHPDIGLPYGSIPRLEMIWITTEAVKRKSREIILGNSLNAFMSELGIPRTGAYIERFKDQTKRLFSCSISCTYDDGTSWQIENVKAVKRASLTWAPQEKEDGRSHESILLLDQEFFNEIISRPVPIDLNTIKQLKNSSLALDIYSWLTYRMSYLNKRTCIPWEALHNQFGSNYANDKSGRYGFKKKFSEQMQKVLALYPDAKAEKDVAGLVLYPSVTHMNRRVLSAVDDSPEKVPTHMGATQSKIEKKSHKVTHHADKCSQTDELDTVIRLVNDELEASERNALMRDFAEYLVRRKLPKLPSTSKKALQQADNSFKQHLYDFVNSQWHHLFVKESLDSES